MRWWINGSPARHIDADDRGFGYADGLFETMEALDMGLPAENLHRLPNHREAIDMLRRIVRPGDLVLVKGSRAVGMDTIVAEITGEAASVTATSQEPVDG